MQPNLVYLADQKLFLIFLTHETSLSTVLFGQVSSSLSKAILSSFSLTILTIAILLLFLAIGIGIWVFQERKKQKFIQKMLRLEHDALLAQMNPHFIFNSMNSIQLFIAKNELKDTLSYVAKFGKLLRRMIENAEKPTITVQDETESLKLYLYFEKLRTDDMFNFQINIQNGLNAFTEIIPAMFIQPFLEKVIWQELVNAEEPGKLRIEFSRFGKGVCCDILVEGKLTKWNPSPGYIGNYEPGIKLARERMEMESTDREQDISLSQKQIYDKAGRMAGSSTRIIIPALKKQRSHSIQSI